MTSLRGDSSGREALGTPSREPLLWVQLLGLAAWPLESLGLVLLLAGGDPGPFPLVERLFCWGLGALVPAVLFWRLPPDLWSVLIFQIPLRGRRERQRRLSALQASLGLKLVGASGALPLLALVWWADRLGGIAWSLSPLAATPRLVVLLACAPLLALMLWQWHQLVQAIWLLSRPSALLTATLPLSLDQAQGQRLNLGLPLLLVPALTSPALTSPAVPAKPPEPSTQSAVAPPARPPDLGPSPAADQPDLGRSTDADPDAPTPEPPSVPAPGPEEAHPATAPLAESEAADEALEASPSSAPIAAPGDRVAVVPLPIDDQQPTEDGQGNDLDQQV